MYIIISFEPDALLPTSRVTYLVYEHPLGGDLKKEFVYTFKSCFTLVFKSLRRNLYPKVLLQNLHL